jgi:putative transposase
MVFHVLNRSVARIALFRHDKDYAAFENVLAEALERLPVELFAYCILSNHWHLVLRPRADGDLSRFMHWLTLTHAQRWRTSHRTIGFGPLYQGRFKSFPIQCDRHLLTALRYVERNPRRANLVRHAESWRWSSLHLRIAPDATHPPDAPADPSARRPLLSDWPIEVPQNWVDLVNSPQTRAEEEALQTAIQKGRPFGSPTWQHRAADAMGLTSAFRTSGRPPILAS